MPLYLDVHSLDGPVTFEDVGKAHQADLISYGAMTSVISAIGWTGNTARSFASLRPRTPTPRRQSTARRTALSLKRSTKCRRHLDEAPPHRGR